MRVCNCVLIVSEEYVVLPTSCPTIILVVKKTRLVLHMISYDVNLITLRRGGAFVLYRNAGGKELRHNGT